MTTSGASFRFLGAVPSHYSWVSASLVKAYAEGNGYELKIDGVPENSGGAQEQMFLALSPMDAVEVIKSWALAVKTTGGEYEQFLLKDALTEIGAAPFVHNPGAGEKETCPECKGNGGTGLNCEVMCQKCGGTGQVPKGSNVAGATGVGGK